MRLRKRNDNKEKFEKQQYDYTHGQLGKQREELTGKIQETVVALEGQLDSKRQLQAISLNTVQLGVELCNVLLKDC